MIVVPVLAVSFLLVLLIASIWHYGLHSELRHPQRGSFWRDHPWVFTAITYLLMAGSAFMLGDAEGLRFAGLVIIAWGLPAVALGIAETMRRWLEQQRTQRLEHALASFSQLAEEIVQGTLWPTSRKKRRKRRPADQYEDASALQARALTTALELRFRMSIRDQYVDPDLFWRDVEELLDKFVRTCHRWRKEKQEETDYPEGWRR